MLCTHVHLISPPLRAQWLCGGDDTQPFGKGLTHDDDSVAHFVDDRLKCQFIMGELPYHPSLWFFWHSRRHTLQGKGETFFASDQRPFRCAACWDCSMRCAHIHMEIFNESVCCVLYRCNTWIACESSSVCVLSVSNGLRLNRFAKI